MAIQQSMFQDMHAEFQAFRQDQWWENSGGGGDSPKAERLTPTGIGFPKVSTPKGRPEEFNLDHDDCDSDVDGHGFVAQGQSSHEEDGESSFIRVKDLHHFKIPTLPQDAGAFRQWKNSLRTLIMSYDRSPDGALMKWVSEAMNAKTDHEKSTLQASSGPFPKFDRVLAAALCKPEHLRSHFGVRFNAYLEECETGGFGC